MVVCLPAVTRVIAAAFAVSALAGGCAGGRAGTGGAARSQTSADGGYQVRLFRAADRSPAPPVSGTTVTGQPLSLASYRGDVVVLNFWGSWCGACRAEAPALGQLARRLYPAGVRFVGVDVLDEPAAALGFMQTFRITYPSISDPGGQIALGFRGTAEPDALPDTVIIGRTDRIAAAVTGGVRYDSLLALIRKVAEQS